MRISATTEKFLLIAFAIALGAARSWAAPGENELRDTLDGAIAYLEQSQKKVTVGEDYFSGEWPSTMASTRQITFIGPAGTGGYDSNSFTVSSIHNALAAIWDRQPLEAIPPMLDLAIERILAYRNGDSFNFWPLLPPRLYKPEDPRFERIRRPNHFPIRYARLEAGCNVYNDADDTAVAFTAIQHYNEVRPEKAIKLPARIGPIFSAYRDVGRLVPHFYNFLHGTLSTGAFMTWLEPERPFDPKSYVPSEERIYLPFGLNDVDCVVNANVLQTLARNAELDTPGVREACEYINWAFRTGRQKSCGVYYPSPYNAHYAVAKAYDAGVACLRPALTIALEEIRGEQREDGSWESPLPGDSVHTGLYALNTLLYSGRMGEPEVQAIQKGMESLLRSAQPRPDGALAWPEGVFFSGGTFARTWIFWKSEAYTTALAADAVSLYLDRFF
ncbi:MAG: hypothetical protein NDJ89_18870 [Oligoflexia bacterium]|nr:hypothetical protein [Oligoflexia bacterium]